jgi:BirA family biotin operon repressor/biotin-[acetyl-CoA-carboxylase] ligase
MDKLSAEAVASGLGTRWLGRKIAYYESIGSTNEEACRLALAGAPEGTLVLADEQTAGRGRLQRRWVSPRGQALLFSIILDPPLSPRDAYQLTMISSLACMHAVQHQTGLRLAIKWPNDLLLDGKKLAGILGELGQAGEQLCAVVGIGLNANVDLTPWPDLHEQATSLRQALGRPVPRLPLLQEILRHFEARYDRLCAGYSPYEEWAANLATLGRAVRVVTSEETLAGQASGADPDGALRLTLVDGTVRRVLVGDVESLRG